MQRRHERPLPRTNPSGKKVWVARYTTRDGDRRSAGTYELRGPCRAPSERGGCCAQHAIDTAYERERTQPGRRDTVGSYAASWTDRHPRAERTNRSYNGRVKQVLDVKLDDRPLRDWPMGDLRRRHVTDLVRVLLVEQKRAASGATGILRVLSAMFEDAIGDDYAEVNPFAKVKVRANDPRVTKAPRRIRTWMWDEMHDFARAAATVRKSEEEDGPLVAWRAVYAEPMIRMLADCGLRIGELLPVERGDLRPAGACPMTFKGEPCRVEIAHLHVDRTAHEGRVLHGTKTDHGEATAGRAVPIPEDLGALLAALPPRIDTRLVFPTPTGLVWRESNFYRDLWYPTRKAVGMPATPHEFRHSWVSLLAAAGVDRADLAAMAGHTLETATAKYTHALGRSFETVAQAVGQ